MKMDRQTKIAIVINVAFVVFAFMFVGLTTAGCDNTFIDLSSECETSADCDDGQPCTTDICDSSGFCQYDVWLGEGSLICMWCVQPKAEICGNLYDDDCNNAIDDGCPCDDPEFRRDCGLNPRNYCWMGTQYCRDGVLTRCLDTTPLAVEENCDFLLRTDNDCDALFNFEDPDCELPPDCVPTDEVCNGLDDDCDGITDEGLYTMYYLDSDGDGYGNSNWFVGYTCPDHAYGVAKRGDCDDSDPTVHPGTGCLPCADTYYRDADSDGYGNPAESRVFSCDEESRAGYVTTPGDCDDMDSVVYDGAAETCNGRDDDCDGQTDEDYP